MTCPECECERCMCWAIECGRARWNRYIELEAQRVRRGKASPPRPILSVVR